MYPILLNLKNRPVLVVGGGKVAARKIQALLENEAQVSVISPSINQEIPQDRIQWKQKEFEMQDAIGFDLVFACTDNDFLNEQIYQQAPSGQLVNNASDKENSDFYNMKVITCEDYTFSVSSQGKNYRDAKIIGNNLKRWLDKNLNELLK